MVTKSKLQLAAAERERAERDSQRQKSRQLAVKLLQEGSTIRAVVQLSETSNGTVMRLPKALDIPELLRKLLDPALNRGGRCLVLFPNEEL